MLFIGFDVDNSLEGYGGPVTLELCNQLREKGAHLYMLSKRDSAEEDQEICQKFHLEPPRAWFGDDYHTIKLSMLLELMKGMNKKSDRFVYVGDRIEDFIVAMQAGALYCKPEALTLDIFEESKNPHIHAIF